MTTITWKDTKSGQQIIRIYRSKDRLDSTLRSCIKRRNDAEKYDLFLIVKNGKKIVQELKLHGVSFEEDDEKAIFQKYGIIPKEDDYYD